MTTRSISRAPSLRRIAAAVLTTTLAAGFVSASALSASAADDPIDGARTSVDPMFPNVGNGGYDALDYDVNIAWTPNATQSGSTIAGTIVASTTMTARALQPLRSFSLDFEGLEVDSVTVNGVAAAFTREIDPAAIKFKLIVTPATAVSGEFTTVVTYHGTPSSHTDADGSSEGWNRTSDGATLLGQPIGMMTGYPHNNTPADKATYTFTIDIPTILNNVAGTAPGTSAAVSNGELLSKTPSADGTRTKWVWDQKKPMASELAIVSIGKYDVIESQVELSDGRVIPSWSFMDSALSTANKTTVTNRVGQLGVITRNLEKIYGPYPGNSTGVVVDTVPSGINYALETQDRSFFPSAGSVGGNTLIHELVHQWYGNNVAPSTWTNIWMGEGMATWGPSYYNSAEGFGAGAASETTYYNSWNNSAATSANWRIAPGSQTDSAALYEYQTYTRGAQFWAALRIAIGDTAFFDLIKKWQIDNAGTSKTGDELRALAEQLSGRDLAAFWKDWIMDADKPAWPDKLNLSLSTDAGADALTRGQTVTYALSATNTGRSPLNASVATIDVSKVLAKATIDPATLPTGVTLQGTTLTWAVPVTAAGAPAVTASFTATLKSTVSGGSLDATATASSLGGTCVSCATSLTISEYPVGSAVPTITGTTQVGHTLTAQTGTWAEGTTFTYEWKVNGEPLTGETGNTLVIPQGTAGKNVTVTVTGSLTGYLPVSKTSESVGPIIAAPVPSAVPTITGTIQVGHTLTAAPGTWADGTTFTYEWKIDGETLTGETGNTLVIAQGTAGKNVTVTVTGSLAEYLPVSKTSESVGPIIAAPVPSAVPTITGTTQVGHTLTAQTGTWADGTTFTYEWKIDGEPLVGATGKTVVIPQGTAGEDVTVTVTGSLTEYLPVSKTSEPVGPIIAAPVPSAVPVITGTTQVGQILTADTGTWADGTTFTYEWTIGGETVTGQTGNTLVIPRSAIGADVIVTVTGSLVEYLPVTKASEPVGPIVAAPAPSESALTPALKGKISAAPSTVAPGSQITVTVGTTYAGESVDGWIFSTPTHLGLSVVSAQGTTVFTVPSTVPAGAHRLVVTDSAGAVIGWTDITVSGLPATGGDVPFAALWWGLVLVAAGALTVLVIQRRRRSIQS